MVVSNQRSVSRLRKLISQNNQRITEVKMTFGDGRGVEVVVQLEQLNQTIEEFASFLENLGDKPADS